MTHTGGFMTTILDESTDSVLGRRLLNYALTVGNLATPERVLDDLHDICKDVLGICVLGTVRFPLKITDWKYVTLGKTAFVHKDVPKGWWEDYSSLSEKSYDVGLMMAHMSLSPYTWTESRQLSDPIGVDRWAYELALKYGMRDGFTCPVGGRWVLVFWSGRALSNVMSSTARIILFAAANFAVMRLEQLVGADSQRFENRAILTPRELAVLRLISRGKSFRDVAENLEIGEETVRTHLKKIQAKLGVKSRTHAVAEALRQQLIP
jgi:DNA-binding CsgD family transcriptional regulator